MANPRTNGPNERSCVRLNDRSPAWITHEADRLGESVRKPKVRHRRASPARGPNVTKVTFTEDELVTGSLPQAKSTPPAPILGKPIVFDPRHGVTHYLMRSSLTKPGSTYPSFELRVEHEGEDPGTSDPASAVAYWLRYRKTLIHNAERRWNVDRRAIAGVIAWEAIENPVPTSSRAVGPGKIHLRDQHIPERQLWPHAVEASGRLPRRSPAEREILLLRSDSAIDYIGAILDMIATVADHYGWNIRKDPAVLGYVFQSQTLDSWNQHLSKKKAGTPLIVPPGPASMGAWIRQNLVYLEDAVGKPALR